MLPIVHTLLNQPQDLIFERDYCEPQCVIMSPTRELAIQIRDVVYKLTSGTIIKQAILYGGTATGHQRNTLNVMIYKKFKLMTFLLLLNCVLSKCRMART